MQTNLIYIVQTLFLYIACYYILNFKSAGQCKLTSVSNKIAIYMGCVCSIIYNIASYLLVIRSRAFAGLQVNMLGQLYPNKCYTSYIDTYIRVGI